MRPGRNLFAGLANSIWTALINLAVVPLYLKYLGVEAYGLIGFFVTLQAVMQLLDLGLAPTANREIARSLAQGNAGEARQLLHSLAVVYWGAAGLIAVAIFLLAPFVAGYWLDSKSLAEGDVSRAVALIGLVIACRWPIVLYQGALAGAQRLTILSAINSAMVTLGSVGAVAILAFVSATVDAFFIWQACVGVVYAAMIRSATWWVLGNGADQRFDWAVFRRIWRFSAGMTAIAAIGITLMQLDKIILSKMLPLAAFGQYMLATTVVGGLYIIVTPLFNLVYPRFSSLVVATGSHQALASQYRQDLQLFSALLFPTAMLLICWGEELVTLWTGSADIASGVAPIISFLAAGTALYGVMHVPYALQIACGMTWLSLRISLILLAILGPLIVMLALLYGALGAAIAWLLLNIIYLFLGLGATHRYIRTGVSGLVALKDIGTPAGISCAFGMVAVASGVGGMQAPFGRLLCGLGFVMLAFLLSFVLSPLLRMRVLARRMAG